MENSSTIRDSDIDSSPLPSSSPPNSQPVAFIETMEATESPKETKPRLKLPRAPIRRYMREVAQLKVSSRALDLFFLRLEDFMNVFVQEAAIKAESEGFKTIMPQHVRHAFDKFFIKHEAIDITIEALQQLIKQLEEKKAWLPFQDIEVRDIPPRPKRKRKKTGEGAPEGETVGEEDEEELEEEFEEEDEEYFMDEEE